MFGCTDIREIRDMQGADIYEAIQSLKVEIAQHTDAGNRVFFFVYAAGHGIAYVYQELILNTTSGNKYPLERELRDICVQAGQLCHVFAVFDMCKILPTNYPGLTYKENNFGQDENEVEEHTGPIDDNKQSFHAMSAAKSQMTMNTRTDFSEQLLAWIQTKNKNGYIKMPDNWIGFDGVCTSAMDAPPYYIKLSFDTVLITEDSIEQTSKK